MRFKLLLVLGLGVFPLLGAGATVRVADPRCEYRRNPLGVDELQPRLSWKLEALQDGAHGLKQSAYQIAVGSAENAADLWDTGRVASDQSIQISYAGKPLTSTQRVYWHVRVWDQNGQPSAWSETAMWSMGLLRPDDWKAKWIGMVETGNRRDPESPYWNLRTAKWIVPANAVGSGDVFFRTTFTVPDGRKIVGAMAVLGGDRGGEFYLNGNRSD